MNPAALATNLADLRDGGILIVNSDAFDTKGLEQAGYKANPLEDGSLKSVPLHAVEMTKLTALAVEGLGLSQKEADKCRNFFAMGLVFWLYDRPLEPTLRFIDEKFGKKPEMAQAQHGRAQGRLPLRRDGRSHQHAVPRAARRSCRPASTRSIIGNTALAYGPDDRGPAQRQAAVPRRLPDHAGQRHPARAGRATRTSTCSRSRPRTKSPP